MGYPTPPPPETDPTAAISAFSKSYTIEAKASGTGDEILSRELRKALSLNLRFSSHSSSPLVSSKSASSAFTDGYSSSANSEHSMSFHSLSSSSPHAGRWHSSSRSSSAAERTSTNSGGLWAYMPNTVAMDYRPRQALSRLILQLISRSYSYRYLW